MSTIKRNKIMIILIGVEKVIEKNLISIHNKFYSKEGIKKNFINLIYYFYETSTTSILLNSKILYVYTLNLRKIHVCPLPLF